MLRVTIQLTRRKKYHERLVDMDIEVMGPQRFKDTISAFPGKTEESHNTAIRTIGKPREIRNRLLSNAGL